MGKNKYIETPEKLYQLFEDYKTHLKENPRVIEKALQSGKVAKESMRVPLTMAGFEVYCYSKQLTVEHYFRNSNDSYNDYCTICSRIKKEIRQDQIEGGMVGQYNPSITQRLNGLTEKQEVEHKGTIDKINIEIIEPNRKEDE